LNGSGLVEERNVVLTGMVLDCLPLTILFSVPIISKPSIPPVDGVDDEVVGVLDIEGVGEVELLDKLVLSELFIEDVGELKFCCILFFIAFLIRLLPGCSVDVVSVKPSYTELLLINITINKKTKSPKNLLIYAIIIIKKIKIVLPKEVSKKKFNIYVCDIKTTRNSDKITPKLFLLTSL
jgi:hypothetical protein